MCSEFSLAMIYFLIIFGVNFFLSKLLTGYLKTIFYLRKMQSIFQKSNSRLIFFFHLMNNQKRTLFLKNLNCYSKTKDILIIGKTIDYLVINFKISNNFYYFSVLKNTIF
jgi:hypothetical protein